MTSRWTDRGDDDLRPAGLRAPSPDQPLRRAATLGHRPSTLTSTILMSNLSTVRWGAPRPALLCQVTYSAPSRVAELARVDIHLGLRKSPPTASLRMLSSRPVTSPALNFELIGGDYVAPRGPRSQRGRAPENGRCLGTGVMEPGRHGHQLEAKTHGQEKIISPGLPVTACYELGPFEAYLAGSWRTVHCRRTAWPTRWPPFRRSVSQEFAFLLRLVPVAAMSRS